MAKVIPSKEIIQALDRSGPVHHCKNCAARMFVRSKSGLCPVCFNDKEPHLTIERLLEDVLDETLPEAVEIPAALRDKLPAATAPIRRRAAAANQRRDEAGGIAAADGAELAQASGKPHFDPADPFAELAWIDSEEDSAGFEALID